MWQVIPYDARVFTSILGQSLQDRASARGLMARVSVQQSRVRNLHLVDGKAIVKWADRDL